MLLPKRVKHRKQHRGRMTGVATRGNKVTYGEYGLMTTEPAWITAAQIEAARIAMTRYTKRGGQVWIKIFPDKPITARPADTRMGKGKVPHRRTPGDHQRAKRRPPGRGLAPQRAYLCDTG